jgi:hypothetical protein
MKDQTNSFSKHFQVLNLYIQQKVCSTLSELITMIGRKATKRKSFEVKLPSFDSLLKLPNNDDKVKGASLIWSTIILLQVVYHPFVPKNDEINFYQKELAKKPETDNIFKSKFSILDQAPEQPVKGEKVLHIGVNSGSFCESSCVEKILKDTSKLEPPKFDNSENILNDGNVSTTGLFQLIEEKLTNLVNRFKSVCTPLNIHYLLNFIPSYVNEVLVALKFSEKKDISNIINNFIIITRISLELKQSKEHQQLHSELIENACSSCLNAFNYLEKIGINIKNIQEFEQLSSKQLLKSSFHIDNIIISTIPNSNLPQDL